MSSGLASDTLGDKMLRSQSDFPSVANLKIIITDGAIEHSNPNGVVRVDGDKNVRR